jgi:hypothetical protein
MRRALAVFEKSLGPDHPDTAKVRNNLAALEAALGEAAGTHVPTRSQVRRILDFLRKK